MSVVVCAPLQRGRDDFLLQIHRLVASAKGSLRGPGRVLWAYLHVICVHA